jgi:hypothetical protein
LRVAARRLPALALCSLLAACGTSPPGDQDNACRIFEEKRDWYEAALATERKWGVPMQIQLAIIRQESGFHDDAKPPRERFLGIPLWWRKSSAYGYAQAKDGTWDWYQDESGNSWASRNDFADASDFVGWYADRSHRTLGISKWDTFNQYLAYHEGHGGWKRKTYRAKPWLIKVARRVAAQASTYGAQLKGCRKALAEGGSWWPF